LRSQPNETTISSSNVKGLKVKWIFTTGDSVSATPTVVNNVVYFPDWAGNLFAVRADTGKQIWSHQISSYNGASGSMSRVSPLVLAQEVIIGDNVINQAAPHSGASIIAVNTSTGLLKWITKVDTHPAAIITGSPVSFNNVIYVGVSSNEEILATVPTYPCCTFRGGMVALNAQTGAILWKTSTVPDNLGAVNAFSGGSIWQPAAIDPVRGSLYAGTGNNYTVPARVEACQNVALQSKSTTSCTPADDHIDSVIAFNLTTGAIKWSMKMNNYDAWTVACTITPPSVGCPAPSGEDFDFSGSGPNLLGNILGIGQKSGIYWALDPDSGTILWKTQVGPGDIFGGVHWGTASDGTNIYVPITDFIHANYALQPSGTVISWGSWAGLDAKTGKILWQTADPQVGALDSGAASVANGVVYVGSMSGLMAALDASTGKILWTFNSVGSVLDGPSIVNGVVYWGSGYHTANLGTSNNTSNNKLFAFSLN
jgi:polyvinyl alcohol dehydrogenase (cytochrome)